MKSLIALQLALLTNVFFAAEFTERPSARSSDDGDEIRFGVAEATDVEVAIIDRDGAVVRRLAARAVEASEQTFLWDGADDRGQTVDAKRGPFQARVRLGLRPVFDEFIGDNPGALGLVRALAVGPGGELFVFHVFGEVHPSDGSPTCTVLDLDGNYLRTILPFPGGLPDRQLQGLKRLTLENGSKVPLLYQAETRSLLPGAGDLSAQRPVATSDGRIAFVAIREGPKRYAQAGINQILVLQTATGVPAKPFEGAVLSEKSSSAASLALSLDQQKNGVSRW